MQQVTEEPSSSLSLSLHEYVCGEGKGRGDCKNSSNMRRLKTIKLITNSKWFSSLGVPKCLDITL